MLTPEVIGCLRCPVCGEGLRTGGPPNSGRALHCRQEHHFDLARQGYVNLLTGRAPAGADTPAMVAARADLLAAGHLGFLSAALAQVAADLAWANASRTGTSHAGTSPPDTSRTGLVVDAGAGTGHHLAAVLERLPGHHGLALDVAKPAARRAARAHPRAGAAICDVWQGLPLADRCADLILNVFAPRHAVEFWRVLRPDGALLVVTPKPDHLTELVRAMGLVGVDPDKDRRVEATLGRLFRLTSLHSYVHPLRLTRAMADRLAAMGPSAWHTDPDKRTQHLARLPEPVPATASVTLRIFRPRPSAAVGS